MPNIYESITSKIATLIKGKQSVADYKTTPSTIQEMVKPSNIQNNVFNIYNRLQNEGTRIYLMERADYYYRTDSRVTAVIDTLARDCVKGGFSITCRNNAQAEDLANKTLSAIELNDELEELLRNWFIDGDLFLENGIDANLNVVEVARRPAKELKRLSNRIDTIVDPTKAYRWQFNSNEQFNPANQDIFYALWQITHARWQRIGFDKYGRPLLASGMSIWQRIMQSEDDMVKARATRAGIVRQHVLEGANPDELNKYRDENKAAIQEAFAAVSNLFSNNKASITQLEGNMNLPPIDDVEHHLESWFAGSPVPMSLIAYGKGLNQEIITLKEKQYRRSIESIGDTITDSIIMPIIELQWLLKGIDPDTVKYEAGWKTKDPLQIADLTAMADAILRLKAAGATPELVATFITKFLPGVDVNWLIGELDAAPPVTSGDPNNINSAMNVRSTTNTGKNGNQISTGRISDTKKQLGIGLQKK